MYQAIAPHELGIYAYIESQDILGNSLGSDSIPRLVQHVDMGNSLVTLARAAWLIEESDANNTQIQIALAEEFFPPEVMRQIKNLVLNGNRIVLFRYQIQVLMKYVARYARVSPFSGKPASEEQLKKLGLALLAVSDMISAEVKRKRRELKADDELKFVTHEVFSTSYLMHQPSLVDSIVRSNHLYTGIPRTPVGQKHRDYLDLNKEFQSVYGMRLDDYMNIGLGVLAHFLRFWQEEHSQTDLSFLLFNPRQWFSTSLLDDDTVNQILKIISVTPADFRNDVIKQSRREVAYDFLAMKSKPLLKFSDETYMPISFAYLFEKLTTGIYWTLFDHLEEDNRLKFSRYNGFLFQEYVLDLLRHINEPNRGIEESILEDQLYTVDKQEFRSPDAMLLGEDYIVLIEASATRLQAKRTTSLGLPEAFESDCEKMILANAKSLGRFIENIKTGKALIPGVESAKIKNYYPVIVLIEGFPKLSVIDKYIEREIASRRLLSGSGIAPLSVLSIEELEAISGHSDLALTSALKGWHATPRFPLTSFSTYIASLVKKDPNGWYKERGDLIFDEASKLIIGRTSSQTAEQ